MSFRSSDLIYVYQYTEPMYLIEGFGSCEAKILLWTWLYRGGYCWQRKELYSLMPQTIILTTRKSTAQPS